MSLDEILSVNEFKDDIDDLISSGSYLNCVGRSGLDISASKSLSDAMNTIINDRKYQKDNNITLTEGEIEILQIIEELHAPPRNMAKSLQNYVAKYFDIDLGIIAFENGRYSVINDDNDKPYKAFIFLKKDNTVCGPLYAINDDGTRETVFTDKIDIELEALLYLCRLNEQEQLTNSSVTQGENIPSPMEQSFEPNSTPFDDKVQSEMLMQHVLQMVFQIFSTLSIDSSTIRETLQPFLSYDVNPENLNAQDAITILRNELTSMLNLCQKAEQSMNNNSYTNVLGSTSHEVPCEMRQIELNSENSLDATIVNNRLDIPLSTTITDSKFTPIYDAPALQTPLAMEHHPRNLKEFANSGSAPVQCSEARQRDQISVEVPPPDTTELFLSSQVFNIHRNVHPLKILVPYETKVENENLMKSNDLSCLIFDKSDLNGKFDLKTKVIHFKINSIERLNRLKLIRLHMVNLYQTMGINRRAVQNQQLKQCILGFWFSIYENGIYNCVSKVFYSHPILENKKKISTNTKTQNKPIKKNHCKKNRRIYINIGQINNNALPCVFK